MHPGLSADLPDPALVVLVGAAGSGKSTWAAEHYRASEIVSSDALRAVVGSGTADLDASADAFELVDRIVSARAGRGLTVVVDTLGFDRAKRLGYLEVARRSGMPAVAVLFDTDPRICRERNAARDRVVPAQILSGQLRRVREVADELPDEGWDRVVTVTFSADPSAPSPRSVRGSGGSSNRILGRNDGGDGNVRDVGGPGDQNLGRDGEADTGGGRPRVMLQLSRFPWGEDPAGWLRSVALAADEVGFAGIALMDHLIQIPQVGRAWDPIPEPWVTLGLLAGLDTRLQLGTLVSPVTFRRPGIIAKTVATLDALSGGRAFCGLGAGWWQREHDGFGLDLPPAGQRLDDLEGCIETLRVLWAPGTKPVAGKRIQLPETTSYPRPTGTPPIIVGGSGARTLRIAAELADACNVPSDEVTLRGRIAAVRQHCAQVGRDASEVEITVLDLPVIGTDRDDTAIRVERLRGRTTAAAFAARHHAGEARAHAERYRGLAELGVGTVFLALADLDGPDDLERCAPLLSALR